MLLQVPAVSALTKTLSSKVTGWTTSLGGLEQNLTRLEEHVAQCIHAPKPTIF